VDGRLEGLTVNFDPVILALKKLIRKLLQANGAKLRVSSMISLRARGWVLLSNRGLPGLTPARSLQSRNGGAKRPLSPHGNHVEEANHPCRNGLLRSDPELTMNTGLDRGCLVSYWLHPSNTC
jgi:hypothetical protein